MASRVRLSDTLYNRYRDALSVSHAKFETEAQPTIVKMQAYLRGQQWAVGKGDPTMPKVVANLVFADAKVMLPVLALRNPRVFVKPTAATATMMLPGPDGKPVATPVQLIPSQQPGQPPVPVPVVAAARAKENLINWRWRQLQINAQVRRCLMDSFTAPFAVMKLGYTLTTEKVDLPDQPGEEGTRLLEVNESIKAQSPFAVRWSPNDFRVDPEARYPDLSDAGWIAFGWLGRLDDLKRNPKYHNTRDLKASVEIKTDYALGSRSVNQTLGRESSDDWQRVQLWEIHDRREGKIITLANDHDKALQYDDWPSWMGETFSAETLVFTEHPDTLYGPPDLWQITGQQDQYNEIAAMISNHVRRFLRKYIAQRGAFDEKEMEKFISPIDGLVIEVDGRPSESVEPLKDAPIPVDWWQSRVNVREDHDRISGIGDFVRGVAEKVDTAAEANIIQGNMNVRTGDSRNIVEDFAERISRQVLRIDSATLDVPTVIPVIGPDGAMALGQFLHIQTRETMLAEADVEVEIGSMQPINEASQKAEMREMYMTLRNDPLIDQFALRKEYLARFHNTIPDGERLLIPKEMFMQVAQTLGGGPPGSAPGPGGPPGSPSPSGAPPGAPPMGGPFPPPRPSGPRRTGLGPSPGRPPSGPPPGRPSGPPISAPPIPPEV